MEKFIRRYMRNEDIERVFQKLKGENQAASEISYDSFKSALRFINIFKDE